MAWIAKNVDFHPYRRMTAWRKLAVGTWLGPSEPNIYVRIRLDAGPMRERIAASRNRGVRVTPLTLVVKAIGDALAEHPQANAVLRMGRIYHRRDVNILVSVLTGPEQRDLTGLLIRQADQKSAEQIATEIRDGSERIRKGEDVEFEQTQRTLGYVPGLFMHALLRLLSFVTYTLNLWTPLLGISRDALGSAQVTSVASLGDMEGFGPLDPYARNAMMTVVGPISDEPVARDGAVVVRPMVTICFTFDHRLVDGLDVGRLVSAIRRNLAASGEPPQALPVGAAAT